MYRSEVRMIYVIVLLMVLFYGEPDLFDAMREALIRFFNRL